MRRFVSLLAVFSLFACGGGEKSTGPQTPAIVGAWTLRTANGASVPAVLQAANPKIEVLDDTYTFNADGTYSEFGHYRTTTATSTTTASGAEIGAWSQTGTSIRLIPTTSGTAAYNASVTNGTMTLIQGQLSLTYQK